MYLALALLLVVAANGLAKAEPSIKTARAGEESFIFYTNNKVKRIQEK
jgi:hypothetical protein